MSNRYNKKYYLENKEKELTRNKKYREENYDKCKINWDRWKKLNPEKVKLSKKNSYRNSIDSWRDYFIDTICEICEKPIKFCSGNPETTICFDHRHGGIEGIKYPKTWLACHFRNEESEKIWNSCDFGKLCNRCNKALFTNGRIEWLKKAILYSSSKRKIK